MHHLFFKLFQKRQRLMQKNMHYGIFKNVSVENVKKGKKSKVHGVYKIKYSSLYFFSLPQFFISLSPLWCGLPASNSTFLYLGVL